MQHYVTVLHLGFQGRGMIGRALCAVGMMMASFWDKIAL